MKKVPLTFAGVLAVGANYPGHPQLTRGRVDLTYNLTSQAHCCRTRSFCMLLERWSSYVTTCPGGIMGTLVCRPAEGFTAGRLESQGWLLEDGGETSKKRK